MEKGVQTRIGRVAANQRVQAIGTVSLTQVPGRIEYGMRIEKLLDAVKEPMGEGVDALGALGRLV